MALFKRIMVAVTLSLVMVMLAGTNVFASEIGVSVNGTPVSFDQPPIN